MTNTITGYALIIGKYEYILESTQTRKSSKLACAMIKEVLTLRGVKLTDAEYQKYYNDTRLVHDVQRDMFKVEIIVHNNYFEERFENGRGCYPFNDCDCLRFSKKAQYIH